MKILLVCSAGMSTSLLVTKMKASAEEKNLSVQIDAVAESELTQNLTDTNVVLIGPQIRYLESKIKDAIQNEQIKVDVIDPMAYGMIHGEKILEQAISLHKK